MKVFQTKLPLLLLLSGLASYKHELSHAFMLALLSSRHHFPLLHHQQLHHLHHPRLQPIRKPVKESSSASSSLLRLASSSSSSSSFQQEPQQQEKHPPNEEDEPSSSPQKFGYLFTEIQRRQQEEQEQVQQMQGSTTNRSRKWWQVWAGGKHKRGVPVTMKRTRGEEQDAQEDEEEEKRRRMRRQRQEQRELQGKPDRYFVIHHRCFGGKTRLGYHISSRTLSLAETPRLESTSLYLKLPRFLQVVLRIARPIYAPLWMYKWLILRLKAWYRLIRDEFIFPSLPYLSIRTFRVLYAVGILLLLTVLVDELLQPVAIYLCRRFSMQPLPDFRGYSFDGSSPPDVLIPKWQQQLMLPGRK